MQARLAFLFALSAIAPAQGGAREDFLKLIDRPRVPLAPKVSQLADSAGLEQFHFTFASEAGERVPGILIRRETLSKLPVVIALHGTGGDKEEMAGLLRELASRGFLAVAIDGRYHGERANRDASGDPYDEAILRAYQTGKGHPFLYDTVWDVLRLIDYLETRPDVDPSRIGVIGISKGGMETWLAAAVDPRIRVAIPCIAVQSFRWELDHDAWRSRIGTIEEAVQSAADIENTELNAAFVRRFYDRIVPGIYSEFDGPSMLPLIAPRPLLTINGGEDALTPRAGVMEAIESAEAAYAAAHAEDKFQFVIEEGAGHQVTPDALRTAGEWLVRWLKP